MLQLTLAGRLGRDAELRQTRDGKSVCNFSVAVDVRRGQEKSTTWVECTLWEKRAEALAQYLTKGTAVAVAGELSVRQYDKRDGGHGVAVECNVREVTLLGGGEKSGSGAAPGYDMKAAESRERERAPAQAAQRELTDADVTDSEIPF